ncbi:MULTISPECIES: 2-polyprenyl-3-methyl-6-methoxy-1,4-benzoquinone monooxygenase [Vreelandella]|uniref:2-polyprenyl-3-methyl-6-methoxy-1,4-benzoquinone monooxygenase n=1 Tax=Vreelandella nanhaiensis TaxID=1258546 RepID=A0A3S0W541_9GAMM|nr:MULTISPECIES: 2-polyprenyl-3-methyl-6-methoxy-1,4-benzoquinone monooxygenase [Halomonas]RUR31894.1 2-polyprenyl-3-methyl-6-methoxy-1,4-benzoquinone monooxygenase [Halomonas nanhaiensis]RUR39037.1 2-polyprenyl-3-methyl-6-methoxy-1,4-benzoquinone monooxygenase [Halomonas populi]RUR50757.1 2-polyprenyl-3-methyl-6-methoxy-1,4-benzoquinone monooxygenase [Halomonas populi]
MKRQLSRSDCLIQQFDTALRSMIPHAARAQRNHPASKLDEMSFDGHQRRHTAGLMRVNHLIGVANQALYQGQSATAALPHARQQMEQSAAEAFDHMAWCEERLAQLNSRTSYFTPLFYASAFGMGAVSGLASDRLSMGMIAASRELAGKHFEDQQTQLIVGDQRSHALLRQMASDEAHQAHLAIESGGMRFLAPFKWTMRFIAQGVTKGAYYF